MKPIVGRTRGADMLNAVPRRRVNGARRLGAGQTALLRGLGAAVLACFKHFTGHTVFVVRLDSSARPGSRNSVVRAHPACCSHPKQACADQWRAQLAAVRRRGRPRWHRCVEGRLCALVPVTVAGECIAACQFVRSGEVGEAELRREVELLLVLVEHFVAGHSARTAGAEGTAAGASGAKDAGGATHPQVRRAIDVIEHSLGRPNLTVARVAAEVGMNSSYLAHLFAREMGVRMSRYIECRRIERARRLLVTTDWQIKRVARESGHGNTGWFSHVFRRNTGMTPGAFRRQARSSDQGAPHEAGRREKISAVEPCPRPRRQS